MDVDAVQKVRSLPLRGCYWCGEANYLVRDCPHYLDIWKLTVEQREEKRKLAPSWRRILFSAAGKKCALVAVSK